MRLVCGDLFSPLGQGSECREESTYWQGLHFCGTFVMLDLIQKCSRWVSVQILRNGIALPNWVETDSMGQGSYGNLRILSNEQHISTLSTGLVWLLKSSVLGVQYAGKVEELEDVLTSMINFGSALRVCHRPFSSCMCFLRTKSECQSSCRSFAMRSGDGRVGFLPSPTVTFSGCKAQSRTTKTFGAAPRRRVLREKATDRIQGTAVTIWL